MAKIFAQRGYDLALCARRLPALNTTKEECLALNPNIRVEILSLDVDDHDAVFSVFEQFMSLFGIIDKIIVNAGIGKGASVGTGHFHANKATAYTNFVSALAQCEAAMMRFRAQNHGHLITISSISAVRGFRRALTVYAASKAALTALTEGIRIDTINTPIKVTTIHPGFIRTDINKDVENVPFIVDTQTGCKAIVNAIEKAPANAYVPAWPWRVFWPILKIAPLKFLRKFS